MPLLSIPRSTCCTVCRIKTGSKWAASTRTSVVASAVSANRPPMMPARATGRSASAITSGGWANCLSTGLSARTNDRAAQKLQCLAFGHATDDNPGARDLLEVEGVEGLAPLVKDVVRDVHDVVDRSHSGQEQPRLEPWGRRGHFHAADEPAHIARA